MLSLAHTLISLPVGVYLHNPLIIFVSAFLLHLLMDTFKHWNIYPWQFKQYPYILVAMDILVGLMTAWFLLGNRLFTIPLLAAIAGGNAPDILHGLWDMLEEKTQNTYFAWLKPFFSFHDNLQLETTNVGKGLIWQIIWITVSLILLLSR